MAGFTPVAVAAQVGGVGVGGQIAALNIDPRTAVIFDDMPMSVGAVVIAIAPVVMGEGGEAHRKEQEEGRCDSHGRPFRGAG